MENTLRGLQGLPGLSEADNAALQQRFRELDSSAYAQYANQEMDEYIKNNYLYNYPCCMFDELEVFSN